MSLAAPLGVSALLEKLNERVPGLHAYALFLLGGASAILLAPQWEKMESVPKAPFEPYRAVGEWMKQVLPKNASVGAAEVGHLGWYSELPIVDLCGLVTPEAAEFLGARDVDRWISVFRPDYLLIHEPAWALEAGAIRALERGEYQRGPTPPVAGYQLLERAKVAEVRAGSLLGRAARSGETVREGTFTIGGSERPGLFVHPTAEVRFRSDAQAYTLRGAIGVAAPAEHLAECDGATFVVVGHRADGSRTELSRSHVLPGSWQELSVSLQGFREFSLRTEPGPSGATTYDWAVWGEPTLTLP